MRIENPCVVYGEDETVEMLTFCMFHVIFWDHHIKGEKKQKKKQLINISLMNLHNAEQSSYPARVCDTEVPELRNSMYLLDPLS